MGVPETVILDANGHELPAGIGQLLAIIARNRTISRAHLEQQSRLSRATIVQRLGVLFNAGLITEADETAPSGGRPSKLLKINETFALTLAADIGESMIRVVLTTLEPRIVAEITFSNSFDIPPETTLRGIIAQGEKLLADLGRKKADLLGVGLSLPAPVDYDNALVVGPSVMRGWDGFDIRGWFRENHAIRVFADNDVNLMAVAEQRAHWPDEDCFFFIKAGTGIGGGIILNGKVLMGAHAAAGEVSCLVSDISKMADDDFKLTSVERYSEAPLWAGMASASGLIFEYARQKHLPTGSPMPTGEEIFAAYNAGEPEAQKALKIFARRVAVGILSLQHVLDVEKVAIGGGISAAEALLPAIQAELDWLFERCTVMPAVKPELVRCRYGNDANLIGALKLFFEQNPA